MMGAIVQSMATANLGEMSESGGEDCQTSLL